MLIYSSYQDPPRVPPESPQLATALRHSLATDHPPPIPFNAPSPSQCEWEACIYRCAMDSASRMG